MSIGSINNVVSKKFDDKIDRARAIYYWIAHNIEFDIKAARTGNTAKNTPTEVLANRRGVGIGFASLFQDMCSSADIRCLTVDGFVKNNPQQINEKDGEINHSWAVVQLGQSPEEWFYVDPAWGSGFADAEMKTFTKSFNEGYFFAEKPLFNLQHFPDNEAWKLGNAPKNKADFFELPIIKGVAYELGLTSIAPKQGIIKTKPGKTVSFSYKLKAGAVISKLSIQTGDRKKIKTKDVNFRFSSGILSFENKFEEESTYPLTIFINGKEFITYMMEVE